MNAVKIINKSRETNVLHGVTGSGKTRVYIELISKALSRNENVLLTYPEISLTPQLKKSLVEVFGEDRVLISHSKLTTKQKHETWLKVYASKSGTVTIGPRSSLFLPHQNLSLLIMDEAHDGSYKQDNGSRYNGLHVAAALSKIHGAKLILGSATPPIQETQQILDKGGSLVCMHDLAITHEHKEKDFRVIDMTKKENITTGSYLLSKELTEKMNNSLSNGMQVLLFLNRRGTAHALLCRTCGWHAECPNCETPLTYHHDTYKIQCHLCGYSTKSLNACPDCGGDLSQRSLGTKAVEEDVKKLFPQASIARFDSDNKKLDSLSENYESISSGDVDILIGTQLITKGLDLPKLQTVGVLQADNQLFLPDFSSEERTFQQLTQVSGRVGRGHSQGVVLMQTYQPKNDIFSFVKDQNWHGFFNEQIKKRRTMNYPPFNFLMKITVGKKSSKAAEDAIRKFIGNNNNVGIKIYGPAPSFYAKQSGKYVWQLVVKSPSRKSLVSLIEKIPKDFQYDLDPISLL